MFVCFKRAMLDAFIIYHAVFKLNYSTPLVVKILKTIVNIII